MPAYNICLKILKFKLAVYSQPDVSNEDRKKQMVCIFRFPCWQFWKRLKQCPEKMFICPEFDRLGIIVPWENKMTKWRLRNERRNSILMTCNYQDLGSASNCFWLDEAIFQPIRSTHDPDLGRDTTSDVIFAGKLVLLLLVYSLTLSHWKEIKKLVGSSRNVGCFLG